MISQVYLATLNCYIIAFIGGASISWSSPITYKLRHELHDNPFGRLLTQEEISWIASTSAIGAIFSPILFGIISSKFGRKISLLISGIPFVISYTILAFANSLALYYFARAFEGMSMGGALTVLPMYIGEIAEDSNRGLLNTLNNCFISGGMLFSYCVGPYTSIMLFNLILLLFSALFMLLFYFLAPETPHYHILKDNQSQAEIVLKKLRESDDISQELEQIKLSIQKTDTSRITDVFKFRGPRKALIICCALFSFQRLSGNIPVTYYAENLFKESDSAIDPAISAIIIGVVQWITTLVCPPLTNKYNRKTLLLLSSIGMVLSEIPLGLYFHLKDADEDVSNISWLPIVTVVCFILTYNLGLAGVPWAIMSELFPASLKPPAYSIISILACILSFVVSKFFGNISEIIGLGPLFWIFAGFCALSAIFVYFYVIESKGKTLQEIQKQLNM